MKNILLLLLLLSLRSGPSLPAAPQGEALSGKPYEDVANTIITGGLATGRAYEMLSELTGSMGARPSGSPQANRAILWARQKMFDMGFDSVWLEKLMVPHWVRGPVEEAYIEPMGAGGRIPLKICALGGSVATPGGTLTAEVVEVRSFEELRAMGEKARGKIIFFNRPMDRAKISPFEAYGGAVDQRGQGAVEAAKAGGVAALVRSMTTRLDDVPHTGAMHYADSVENVPAAAVSTVGARLLDSLLSAGKTVRISMRLSCETLPDVEQANVIGEIRGSEFPGEVIVVGGHLDSWDKGTGAHDDGAGCVQSIEALRLIRAAGLRPKRTIRAVLFINEENGLRGGVDYASRVRGVEKHILAIESDAGGFAPRGFGVSTDPAILAMDSAIVEKLARWSYLFAPIDADRIRAGGGGADISPLGRLGVPCVGLRPEAHRYFDYHHSDSDTFDKVNERELELGAAALAILSYVIAQEGL
ncbi:MAG TPA: M20/M25/M40 family metallo-hydrolase [Bacteroidota bacterium]|nr:M20/M25/M40 family metallo-hydrolase [Bacteroidota bacterium]